MSTNSSNDAESSVSRRRFVQAAGGVAAMSAAGLAVVAMAQGDQVGDQSGAAAQGAPSASLIRAGDVILFQGDSITDAGRKRDDYEANSQPALGNGYAWLAAAKLLVDHASADLTIYNRGVSGNKVYQLDERWDADCIKLKPNVVSILIGVNDIWHKLNGNYDGTLERYETDYRALLARTKQELPDVRLVVCEPFVLRCGAVTEKWFPEFDGYCAAARKVAEESGATFVPFQSMFDGAAKIAPPERWAKDGVHPSADGAALMAHEWLKTVMALH
jgi:lysophospholipase L1-like esterase